MMDCVVQVTCPPTEVQLSVSIFLHFQHAARRMATVDGIVMEVINNKSCFLYKMDSGKEGTLDWKFIGTQGFITMI